MIVIISRGGRSWLSWSLAVLLTCTWLAGCRKHKHATAAASASATPSSAPPVHLSNAPESTRWGGEARRGRIERSDPLLAKAAKLVASHFPGKAPTELDYQSAALTNSARALLLKDGDHGSEHPLLLAMGPRHQILWSRKRPLAGIVPGIHHVTLSNGPRGNVALFWFNEQSATVATRMWDVGGGLLMDTEVMETDNCRALSVFYWPHHGWVVAAAGPSSFLVQLLAENGDRDFGADGKTIATRWRATAPVSIAADTPDTVMLFHLGYLALSPNATSGDHVFVNRYDAHGTPLWRGPLDAGRLPSRVRDESVRVRVRTTKPGVVLASLPDKAAGGHFEVEVHSAGNAELR